MAVSGAATFLVVAFLTWLIGGEGTAVGVPILFGVIAVLIAGAGILKAHLFYLTPRHLLAAKQRQLDAERRQFESELEKAKQAAQIAAGERDVLKSKVTERPLRPLEVRQEIDQLIKEGQVLLKASEESMIGEAELWFEDVERFAQRHLSTKQYDQLHQASPEDLVEQVQRHRARENDETISEEEFALAERVVRINAGLMQVRQSIRG